MLRLLSVCRTGAQSARNTPSRPPRKCRSRVYTTGANDKVEIAEIATTIYTTYFNRWNNILDTLSITANGKNIVTTASADVTMETVILPAVRTVVRPGLEFCLTRAAIPLSIITVLLIMPLTVTER